MSEKTEQVMSQISENQQGTILQQNQDHRRMITDILTERTNINDYMTLKGDPITIYPMDVYYENGILCSDQEKNEQVRKKLKSILFISECLTHVRIASKNKQMWEKGQLTSWKMFEIYIHEDFNISVVVQTSGSEMLRLMPPSQQEDNFKIGTHQVFYLLMAACSRMKLIKTLFIKEHFEQYYNYLDFQYNIFGHFEVGQDTDSDFKKFEELCSSFLTLNFTEIEICSFFDLVYECVQQAQKRNKLSQNSLSLNASMDTSTGSISAGKAESKETTNYLQNIYLRLCTWFFEKVSSQKHDSIVIGKITSIERGQKIEVEGQKLTHAFLADFVDNFCYHFFISMFEGEESLLVNTLKSYFDSIAQIKAAGYIEQLQVSYVKQILRQRGFEQQADEKFANFIKLGEFQYDIQELQNLNPLMSITIKEAFESHQNLILRSHFFFQTQNILTYISSQLQIISKQWLLRSSLPQIQQYSPETLIQTTQNQYQIIEQNEPVQLQDFNSHPNDSINFSLSNRISNTNQDFSSQGSNVPKWKEIEQEVEKKHSEYKQYKNISRSKQISGST